MAHAQALGLEVFLVVGIGGQAERDLLDDFQSVAFETDDFFRVVGEEPHLADFPALDLARRAGIAGGTLPAVFNAANEVAVDAFRAEKIPFPGIWQTVAAAMDAHEVRPSSTLESVVAADGWARETAANFIAGLAR